MNGSHWAQVHPNYKVRQTIASLQKSAQNGSLERLENADCIRAYAQNFVENRRNLILVVEAVDPVKQSNSSVLSIIPGTYFASDSTQYNWMCGADLDPGQNTEFAFGVWACSIPWLDHIASTNAKNWNPNFGTSPNYYPNQTSNSGPVQYCLSQPVDGQCHVNVLPLFLGIVVACNFIKVVCFIWTLKISQREQSLITTGDAIQSFLDSPDPATRDRCLAQKRDFERLFGKSKKAWREPVDGEADVWRASRLRWWGRAVRARYWFLFSLITATCIIITGVFFGPDGLGGNVSSTWPLIWYFGIGQPQPNFEIGAATPRTGFLLANLPQIVASYLYLMVNSILTSMLAMQEWTSFASGKAKGLRVTHPVNGSEQRKTFFLSIPFRWAIPSLIVATMLHWLCSQMLFLGRIEVIDFQGIVSSERSTTRVFYSALAMLFVVSLASAIVLGLILLALFKRYPPAAPLAGCCSASIAAACQPVHFGAGEFPQGLSQRRLRWGVVESAVQEGNVGHATFSDEPVGKLVKNMRYA